MPSLTQRYATSYIATVMGLIVIFLKVRDNYLTTIDNLQQVDRDVIFDSETQNRSSSRYDFVMLPCNILLLDFPADLYKALKDFLMKLKLRT